MSSPRQRVAALLYLCRALDGRVEPRSDQRRRVHRPRPIDWNGVIALAVELWVASSLWSAVQELDSPLPAYAADRLREHHRATAVQNLRFRHRLTEAVRALNAAGIVPLLFKGGLQLVDGTTDGLGDRWMLDLDLVLHADEMAAAVDALRGIGYEPAPGKPFMHPHELPLVHDRAPGPIELHVELGSPPIPSVLPVADAWASSSELSLDGARARALSPTHQVLHNVLHSAVQDEDHAVAALPLRQLLTLARLALVHDSAIDWAAICARMQAHDLSSVLADHLWLAHRLAGLELPDGPWGGVGARLHEARVLASFSLGWPADLQRNVRHAFGRAYLDALYAHGNRPLKLAGARARHAAHVLRRDGRGALREALERKVI